MLFAPILSLLLMVLGSGFLMSYISIFFKKTLMSEFEIGMVQSAFYLGMLISSLRSENLIRRVGHIRSLTATCGLLTGATLILFIFPANMWIWFRFIAGACVGSFYVAVESWLIAEFPENRRGFVLAIYTITIYSAQSLSQLLLTYTSDNTSAAIIISALFVSLAAIPISVGKSSGPQPSVAEPESLFKFLRLSPSGVLGCLIAGMILSSLYTFMPIYFEDQQYNTGFLMTVMILGGATLQYPIGKISDHFERRKVLVGLGILGFILSLFMCLISSEYIFQIALFGLGGILFTIYPVSMALGCDCVKQDDIVKMTGVMLFAYGLGAVSGPLITPMLRSLTNNFAFLMVAIYSLLLSSVGYYALINRKTISVEDQSQFSVIPTGPIVEDMYPHTDETKAQG